MTWTYTNRPDDVDENDPKTFRDRVRFLAGDTDHSNQLLTDEEVYFAIETECNSYLAAALLLDGLATKFSYQVSKSIGSLSVSGGDRSKAYADRAKYLRSKAAISALPKFGGQSISEKIALDQDPDAVQPSFRIGQHDNPRNPSQDDEYVVYDPFYRWK